MLASQKTKKRKLKLIFFFVDGIGIGLNDSFYNPCVHSEKHFLDHFQNHSRNYPIPFNGLCKGLDASLGIQGLPQSATAQTSIFAGINAAELLGHHLSGFPNKILRKILLEHSLLKNLNSMGFAVDFLNTFTPNFLELETEKRIAHRKASCTTISALAAGIPFHNQQDLSERHSLCHDLTNEAYIERGFEAPLFSVEESAEILARSLSFSDFVLFEFFQTDLVGHAQDMTWAKSIISKVERFLEKLLSNLDLSSCTLLLVSDHGNFEDLSTHSHTLNPALFMVWGRHAQTLFDHTESIRDLYPCIMRIAAEE